MVSIYKSIYILLIDRKKLCDLNFGFFETNTQQEIGLLISISIHSNLRMEKEESVYLTFEIKIMVGLSFSDILKMLRYPYI